MGTVLLILAYVYGIGLAYCIGYLACDMRITSEVFKQWSNDNDRLIGSENYWKSSACYRRAWVRFIGQGLEVRFIRWIQSWKIMSKFPKLDIFLEGIIIPHLKSEGGIYTESDQAIYDEAFSSEVVDE